MMALAFAILMPQTIVASSDASQPVVPVTIKKDKDNKGKVKFMPEKGIEIELLFVDGTVYCQPVSYQANQVGRNTEIYE